MSHQPADQRDAIELTERDQQALEAATNPVVENIQGANRIVIHLLNDVLTKSVGLGAPIGLLWAGIRSVQSDNGVSFGENALASLAFATAQPTWEKTMSGIFDRWLTRLDGTPQQISWYRNLFAQTIKHIADGSVLGACLYAYGEIGRGEAPLAESAGALMTAFAIIPVINFSIEASIQQYHYQTSGTSRPWNEYFKDWLKANKETVTTIQGLVERATKLTAFTTYGATNLCINLIWQSAGLGDRLTALRWVLDMIVFFSLVTGADALFTYMAPLVASSVARLSGRETAGVHHQQ